MSTITPSPDLIRRRRTPRPAPGSSPGLLSQSLFAGSQSPGGLLSPELLPAPTTTAAPAPVASPPLRFKRRRSDPFHSRVRDFFDDEADESEIDEFHPSDDSPDELLQSQSLGGFVVKDTDVSFDDDIQDFDSPDMMPFYLRSLSSQHAPTLGFKSTRPRRRQFVIPLVNDDPSPDHSDPICFTGQSQKNSLRR